MPETTVTSLHVAPEHHDAMQPRDAIEVEAGTGVVGDRFHGTRLRHVSVQSRDDLEEAARVLGAPVPDAGTRRTVTVAAGPLPTEPGSRIVLGEVVLEVVRLAAPCRLMEDSLGSGGRAALRRRGGVVCRAVGSGVVRVGDRVELG